jgi:hypothetical protein
MSLVFPYENNGLERYYIPKAVHKYPCVDRRSKIKKGVDMYRGIIHRYIERTKGILDTNQFDIVVLDHSITACGILPYIIKNTLSKVIVIHHNIEMEYLKDNKPPLSYRYPLVYFQNRAENDCLKLAHLNLCLTEHDRLGFQKKNPEAKIFTMGDFEFKGERNLNYYKSEINSPIFVISGSLDFPQSNKAVISFLNDYWEDISDVYKDAQLIITGRNPSKNMVEACSRWNNVQLIPSPKDIIDIIGRGRIYICPLNTGGGIKLRIRDALRLGMPVVAHAVSANGYECMIEKGYLKKYSNGKELMDAVGYFMRNNDLANEIVVAYDLNFGYNSGLKRVKSILMGNDLL